MAERKTPLKPSRPRRKDLKGFTERAQEIHDRLAVKGYRFSDSTEIVRADRDSRV